MLKKAKAQMAGDDAGRIGEGPVAGGARFVAPDLARRAGRVLARAGGGHEGVRDAGEAGRAARGEDAARGGRTPRRRRAAPPTAKAKEVQQMASAAPGTSSSRCSRIASSARCRSSASTRRTTSQRLAERVDELSDAVNALLKAAGASRRAKPRAPRAAKAARRRRRAEPAAKAARQDRAQAKRGRASAPPK